VKNHITLAYKENIPVGIHFLHYQKYHTLNVTGLWNAKMRIVINIKLSVSLRWLNVQGKTETEEQHENETFS
jgi:hypothetical protein